MRKVLLFAVTVISCFSLIAKPGMDDIGIHYKVISDTRDETIQKSSFVVEGVVFSKETKCPVDGVQVSADTPSKMSITDTTGRFRINASVQRDSVIYFYKQGWREVVLENYPFKSQHRLVVHIFLEDNFDNVIKRKPVIYIYSDRPQEMKIELDPKGELTFSYPAYHKGWHIQTNDSGGITDLYSGKTHPYLFWEALSDELKYDIADDAIEGFMIHTDTVISFFEASLTELGLSRVEQTDFITFWAPILQKKSFAFIQFKVDEDYESIASLRFSVQPDAIRRVYMLFTLMDEPVLPIPVIPQVLNSFERKSFTVVEWGGSELDNTFDKHL